MPQFSDFDFKATPATLLLDEPVYYGTLTGLKIDEQAFIDFLNPTFSALDTDPYDSKLAVVQLLIHEFPNQQDRLRAFLKSYYEGTTGLAAITDLLRKLSPAKRMHFNLLTMQVKRKRSAACLELALQGDDFWKQTRIKLQPFSQDVAPGDPRKLTRIFSEMDHDVTDHPLVQQFIASIATIVHHHCEATRLRIHAHQMFAYADLMSPGDNAPEGMHRDGADFIVSALVIERAGIEGGRSIVYAPDQTTEILSPILHPGEFLFQDDRSLYHDVTKISEDPDVPPEHGSRSIFGLDIEVL